MASKIVEVLPFEDDTDNYCYIHENEANLYFEFYGEEDKVNPDSSEAGVPDAPMFHNAIAHFNDNFKDRDESYWASYIGPATDIGCAAASYDVYKKNRKFASLEGIYCVFFTIDGDIEEYSKGKPCSECLTGSCDTVYKNLCNDA